MPAASASSEHGPAGNRLATPPASSTRPPPSVGVIHAGLLAKSILDDMTLRASTLPPLPTDVTDWRAWVSYATAWTWEDVCDSAGADATAHHSAAPSPGRGQVRPTLRLDRIRETVPGEQWQHLFRSTWPAYRSWYLAGNALERPSLEEAREALTTHLPELVPTWEHLVDLAGCDPVAARMLTGWRMPPFISGCTQGVVPGSEPLLVRNYDYDLSLFEGIVASTDWSGHRRVLGTSDLLWGLLDGINEDGLAVSLTWGGQPGQGEGFGIPIVIRYLLETCGDVADAVSALRRIPVAQAYNLSLVDTSGAHATVFVAPGKAPEVSLLRSVANHPLDRHGDSPTAAAVHSKQRQAAASDLLLDHSDDAERLGVGFAEQPLHNPDHSAGWGTLYTAVLEPARGQVTYHWPGRSWTCRFDDEADGVTVLL